MTNELADLRARKATVLEELRALTPARTYTIDGQSVDHDGYRRSLLAELRSLNALIVAAEGPVALNTRGAT